jgi:adenylosuccinate lyase
MTIDDIWSDEYLVRLERRLWICVMEAQSMLGPGPEPLVTDQQIFDSRAVQDYPVDLEAIHQRELVTRHDIKARLDEFVHLPIRLGSHYRFAFLALWRFVLVAH